MHAPATCPSVFLMIECRLRLGEMSDFVTLSRSSSSGEGTWLGGERGELGTEWMFALEVAQAVVLHTGGCDWRLSAYRKRAQERGARHDDL